MFYNFQVLYDVLIYFLLTKYLILVIIISTQIVYSFFFDILYNYFFYCTLAFQIRINKNKL